MTYRAVVKDYYDDDNSYKSSGFETPQEAFDWAKKMAEGTGVSGIFYWVEDESISPVLEEYYGHT